MLTKDADSKGGKEIIVGQRFLHTQQGAKCLSTVFLPSFPSISLKILPTSVITNGHSRYCRVQCYWHTRCQCSSTVFLPFSQLYFFHCHNCISSSFPQYFSAVLAAHRDANVDQHWAGFGFLSMLISVLRRLHLSWPVLADFVFCISNFVFQINGNFDQISDTATISTLYV